MRSKLPHAWEQKRLLLWLQVRERQPSALLPKHTLASIFRPPL